MMTAYVQSCHLGGIKNCSFLLLNASLPPGEPIMDFYSTCSLVRKGFKNTVNPLFAVHALQTTLPP